MKNEDMKQLITVIETNAGLEEFILEFPKDMEKESFPNAEQVTIVIGFDISFEMFEKLVDKLKSSEIEDVSIVFRHSNSKISNIKKV
jgi:hypothetical protein